MPLLIRHSMASRVGWRSRRRVSDTPSSCRSLIKTSTFDPFGNTIKIIDKRLKEKIKINKMTDSVSVPYEHNFNHRAYQSNFSYNNMSMIFILIRQLTITFRYRLARLQNRKRWELSQLKWLLPDSP